MGGPGSGRRNRNAPKTSQFLRLSLSFFPEQFFNDGQMHRLYWRQNSQIIASISYSLFSERLELQYSVGHDLERERIQENIRFYYSDQPNGGERRWFLCPRCLQSRHVLYGGYRFRCRQCQGAVYPSSYDPFPQLPWSRCHRIREKLGGEPGFGYPFPERPKGMHHKTYDRLKRQDEAAAEAIDRAYETYARRLKKE